MIFQDSSRRTRQSAPNRTEKTLLCGLLNISMIALLFGLALNSCAEEPPPFQSTILAGDRAVPAGFEGWWYEDDGRKVLEIRSGPPARLFLRVPAQWVLVNAWSADNKIYFSLELDGARGDYALVLIGNEGDDNLYLSLELAREELQGNCGYYLTRFTVWELGLTKAKLGLRKAKEVEERISAATWAWLLDVL